VNYHKVHALLTARGHGSKVRIDGKEIEGLTHVAIEAGVGKITTVTLTFYADVSMEGEAADGVHVPEFRHLRSDVSP
jgi:hypothetical protein